MFVRRRKTHIDSRNRRAERARDLPRGQRILESHRALRANGRVRGADWRVWGTWESQMSV